MQKIELKNKTFEQITYYKTGEGPSLLLVHGFPANVFLWRELIPELSKNYTLLLPNFFEQKGDWIKDGKTSMSLLADAFNDILESENIESTLFAGHSMGGYMGLAFATKYPNKIKGLSLIHSSPLADDEMRAEGRKKTIKILENGGKAPFLKMMVKALFPDDFNALNPDILSRQTKEAIEVEDESLIAFYKAIMERTDTTELTKNAKFPIQNIIGYKDSLSNPKKEIEGRNLSFVNFVHIYENVGHMAMLENPKRLLKDLKHFLNYCMS